MKNRIPQAACLTAILWAWQLFCGHASVVRQEKNLLATINTRKDDQTTINSFQGRRRDQYESASPFHFYTFDSFDESTYGAMFTIEARVDITITSLGFRSQFASNDAVEVQVYTLNGTYEGYEIDKSAWTLVSDSEVIATGDGIITYLPEGPDFFKEVPVKKGAFKSFFIALSRAEVQVSKIDIQTFSGKQVSYNPDMYLLDGSATSNEGFSGFTPQRMFNGVINYERGIVGSSTEPQAVEPNDWGQSTKELETTMEAGDGSFGCVFFVRSKELFVKVQSIGFHTAKSDVAVKIYTRTGEFIPKSLAKYLSEWTLVADTRVTGAGIGIVTEIPNKDFTPISITPESTQSFYVTLETRDLKYSEEDLLSVGDVFTGDEYLDLLVGYGVEESLTTKVFDNRVFNGNVLYVTEANLKTAPPTPSPTSPWAQTFAVEKSLKTTLAGGSGGFGCMFEVHALKDLVVESLDIHVDTTDKIAVEIYTMDGSYLGKESEVDSWRKVADLTVMGNGQGQLTPVREDSDGNRAMVPVPVEADQVQSFYVRLPTASLFYTNRDVNSLGQNSVANQSIEIKIGTGVGTEDFGALLYEGREFNGVVNYNLEFEDPPPPPPPPKETLPVAPTTVQGPSVPVPTQLITQQFIKVAGVPNSKLRRILKLENDRILLQESVRVHFEKVTFDYVQEGMRPKAITITHVISDPNISFESLLQNKNVRRILEEKDDLTTDKVVTDDSDKTQEKPKKGNQTQVSNEKESDSKKKDDSTFGIATTISGDYFPPPEVNFDLLIELLFRDKGEVPTSKFVEELKQDPFFESARSVEAKPVRFAVPKEILEDNQYLDDSLLDPGTLLILFISVGCGLLFCLMISAMFGARWRKAKLAEAAKRNAMRQAEQDRCAMNRSVQTLRTSATTATASLNATSRTHTSTGSNSRNQSISTLRSSQATSVTPPNQSIYSLRSSQAYISNNPNQSSYLNRSANTLTGDQQNRSVYSTRSHTPSGASQYSR